MGEAARGCTVVQVRDTGLDRALERARRHGQESTAGPAGSGASGGARRGKIAGWPTGRWGRGLQRRGDTCDSSLGGGLGQSESDQRPHTHSVAWCASNEHVQLAEGWPDGGAMAPPSPGPTCFQILLRVALSVPLIRFICPEPVSSFLCLLPWGALGGRPIPPVLPNRAWLQGWAGAGFYAHLPHLPVPFAQGELGHLAGYVGRGGRDGVGPAGSFVTHSWGHRAGQ